ARILARGKAFHGMPEVVPRLPTELRPGALVDIHALDRREHLPSAFGIDLVIARVEPAYDRTQVVADRRHLLTRERRGRADHVPAEADLRRTLQSTEMRAHH